MDVHEYEVVMMESVKRRINASKNPTEINQIYKQARTWNRLHRFFAGACTVTRYNEINAYFKQVRWDRRSQLKEET